jgi:hypothetical protein
VKWFALLLLVLTGCIFYPVASHEFVDFDDFILITNHPLHLAGLSPASLAAAFTTPYHSNWIPVTSVLVQLEYVQDITDML